MVERPLLVATEWPRDQPQLAITKQYRRDMSATTLLTRTAYADEWIQNNIEVVPGAVTPLSGDNSIYSLYEIACERDGYPPLTKQMLSRRITVLVAIKHRIEVPTRRGRSGVVFEGLCVKEPQKEEANC